MILISLKFKNKNMKTLLITLFTLLTLSASSQKLAKYKLEMDSLSKIYKVKVCGYTHTIVDNRESLIIFYRKPTLDMEEKIAWTRIIN